MKKIISRLHTLLAVLLILSITGQNVALAKPARQEDKPRVGYSDETGKVTFIGADANNPLFVRGANMPGFSRSQSAMAMVAQYAADFGLQNPEAELELLSEKQLDGRNVTRFQQMYQGIPVIAGELVVNATDSNRLLSLSGEVSPNLKVNTTPSITAQEALQTALLVIQKSYGLAEEVIEISTPELWIYDARLLWPDGSTPTLVWRMEATARDGLEPLREFILIDATRGHVVLNFNQVDTAWNHAHAGATQKRVPLQQDVTPTPTPIEPTATPEPPQPQPTEETTPPTEFQPTPTPPAENQDANEDKSPPQPQAGLTYYVDIVSGNNSNTCTTPASPCKNIQEAINKSSGSDTFYITAGTYYKSTNPSPNVLMNNGKDLILSGGWNSTFTQQNGVTIIDGQNTNNGYLHNGGTVTIDSFIIQNSLSSNSGAIYIVAGNLTITRSTLKNNTATNNGAGIFIDAGNVSVTNSTISGNTASSAGGGIFSANNFNSTLTILNSTISNNNATTGGGIARTNGTVTIKNTIIANNTATTSADCNGTINTATYNIIESASGCTITTSSNNLNVDPALSSLSGTYQVHTPNVGSSAINGGTNSGCPATDQVGNTRPQGTSCDIGSVEKFGSGTKAIHVFSGTNQSTIINTAFSSALVALVLDENDLPVSGVNVTFTAPVSDASAAFNSTSTNTTTVATDANGRATTSLLTANGSTGTYNVTASATGYTSTVFQLTNSPVVDPNGKYVSTTGNDTSNNCSSPSTPCKTVNRAISQAVAGNVIYVAEGVYTSTSGSYVFSIDKSLTISGGWNSTFTNRTGFSTIDGQNTRTGVFSGGSGPNTLEFLIVQNGYSYSFGGGIAINSITVINNSIIRNNAVNSNGGGISISFGLLTLNNSTVENNSSNYYGGGISVYSLASLTINNSTINGNQGTGIYLNGVSSSGANPIININNSTIANNSQMGIHHNSSSPARVVTVKNSIIANNSGGDCSGTINNAEYSLIGNPTSCTIVIDTSNLKGVNPLLSDYPVGILRYLTLKTGSPALNSGSNCLTTDQRGVLRPQGTGCERGSFEFVPAPGSSTTFGISVGSGQSAGLQKTFATPLVVYVTDANGNPVSGAAVTLTAPASGASGVFQSTGTNIFNAITNETGLITPAIFVSNSQVGSYQVTATVSGLPGSVNFDLKNAEWYVSSTGNDGNSCQTPAAPCQTINGALNKSSHGEIIKVTSEIYNLTQPVNITKGIDLSGGWNNTFTSQNGFTIIQSGGALSGIVVSTFNYPGSVTRFVTRSNTKGIEQTSGTFTYTQVSSINNDNGIRITGGTANFVNSTISGNDEASLAGSAISLSGGNVYFNYSTITNNSGTYSIYSGNANSRVYLSNSIFAKNPSSSCHVSNTTSNGNNVHDVPTGCTFIAHASDKAGVDPQFGIQLATSGVYTIKPNSPAIDSGGATCPATDQLGDARTAPCDIGAFEFSNGGGAPAYIQAYQAPGGARISTAATPNFAVLVTNAQGKAVENITVTFTAPVSGASGTFANNSNITTAQTNANGVATASTFTVNATQGAYTVTASIQELPTPVSFNMVNTDLKLRTYNMFNQTPPTRNLPGQLVCTETNLNCTNGVNLDADKAHLYAYQTYIFYLNQHGRLSFNNANMDVISSVDYGDLNFQNAFWSGTQMVYGNQFSLADDIVAHEYTHGVTQYESRLFYYFESGAISESLSDIWGELLDQQNGQGNDAENVKWLLGEDAPGGAMRSMKDPTQYSDPDNMGSYYFNDTDNYLDDNGGVHTNSGVNNKAAYLLVEGGTHYGRTVAPLGVNKTLAIYYEVQTNLLASGSDYDDLYHLLYQACVNLIGGPQGITSTDCNSVSAAREAVDMNRESDSTVESIPFCNPGSIASIVHQENFESGLGSWTINNGAVKRWQYDSPYGPYTPHGQHFLYANDYPQSNQPADARAQWSAKSIPAGAYMNFSHAYDFESSNGYNWDGGVLEYSINGGSTWVDAGSLITLNGENGLITTQYNSPNPLRGRWAFTGNSKGYQDTRLDLSSLAGKNVNFRWRMGLDGYVAHWGWWVDNIQIYTCDTNATISGNAGVPGATINFTNGSPVITPADGSYQIQVPVSSNKTVTPSHACYTFTPTSREYGLLSGNLTNENYTAALIPNTSCTMNILRAGSSPTNADSVDFTVNFTSNVTDVDENDFALTTTGVSGAAITVVTPVSASVYTVSVNTGSGNGTIRLDIPNTASIKSPSNNDISGLPFTSGEVYTINKFPTSATFGDVPMNHPYWADIEILYANGFTAGCSASPLLFCPETTMNRGESAVFMLRGNFGPSYVPPAPPYATPFMDNWAPGPYAQKWAQGMLAEGLTAGCSTSPLRYCPWEQMPRLQAAVFGMRLKEGIAYNPPAATGTVFADITDPSLWYAKWAEAAYNSGILPACGTQGGKPLFCPNELVSRGLGAYMIVRAKNLSMP